MRLAGVVWVVSMVLWADDALDYEKLLTDSLYEVSSIASATKINVDDTTAMVEVLRGDEAMALGATTLIEALALLGDTQIAMESNGAKILVMRGINEKAKIKLLIDGISVANAYRGSIYHFYDLPIELIERIEIRQGPDATLYGSNAIAGVINVITKAAQAKGENLLFGHAQADLGRVGAIARIDTESFTGALDAFYVQGVTALAAGPDKNKTSGTTNESQRYYGAGLHGNWSDLKVMAQLQSNTTGMAYGLSNILENPKDKAGSTNLSGWWQIAQENIALFDGALALHIGGLYYAQNAQARYTPAIIYESSYNENSLNAHGEWLYQGWEHQTVRLGVESIYAVLLDTSLRAYYEANNSALFADTRMVSADVARAIVSLYGSDTYEYSDKTTFEMGARADWYSDFGWALSPKVGVLHRYSPALNLKFALARAFRAPSWMEMYGSATGVSMGNAQLLPENVVNAEFGLIYRPSLKQRLTLQTYAMGTRNLILRNNSAQYEQGGLAYFVGAQSQWEYQYSSQMAFGANVAMNRPMQEDGSVLHDVALVSASGSLRYRTLRGIEFASFAKHVSTRLRESGDTRGALAGYTTFDQTVGFSYMGATYSLIVKNLFDERVLYPAPTNTYEGDYLRQGREIMFKAAWNF